MTGKALVWNENGKRFYETGVEKGVLYTTKSAAYDTAEAWDGLISVSEKPSGAEATPLYAGNIKYLNLMSAEEFACSIEAYMCPDGFAKCDGLGELQKGVYAGQQKRETFGLSYVTRKGNDEKGVDLGYKIHLVYGCLATPSEKSYSTINDSPEAMTMSWEITTTPVNVTGMKPTAYIVIDSTTVDPTKLQEFEKILYGDVSTAGKLPMPDEVKQAFNA